LNKIEIFQASDDDSRVTIRFADKFTKRITSPDIDKINFGKTVTFDIHQAEDGTITLTNIRGLKVRSKVWVNLTSSSIDPNGQRGAPVAMVTAKKLGITRTVQTVVPKPVYDRLLSVVDRVRHPELHSPWHKALQERFKNLLHPNTTATTNSKTNPAKTIDPTHHETQIEHEVAQKNPNNKDTDPDNDMKSPPELNPHNSAATTLPAATPKNSTVNMETDVQMHPAAAP
jgi:hypothetical protein